MEDGDKVLKRPILYSEYGWSDMTQNFSTVEREKMYKTILNIIYKSAKKKRSGAGALVWQFLVRGIEEFGDDFTLIPSANSLIHSLFVKQSCRLAKFRGRTLQNQSLKELC